MPSAAIAGHTIAGKSSLLNRVTGVGVLVEDALFATLDPTTRRTTTADGRVYTFTDTVGFVRHLPHDIVEAFRSTLEEVADADLLLHVVDGSHPDPMAQIATVREVLAEIGAGDVPEIIVVNKADVADPITVTAVQRREPHSIVVSARSGAGLAELRALIECELPRPDMPVEALVPYERGDLVSRVHSDGTVDQLEHTAEGTRLVARVHPDLAHDLAPYVVTRLAEPRVPGQDAGGLRPGRS